MSDTPGPRARDPSMRNGRARGRAVVEHGVRVADEQDAGAAVAAPPPDHQVAELPFTGAGRVRAALDVPPERHGTVARTDPRPR